MFITKVVDTHNESQMNLSRSFGLFLLCISFHYISEAKQIEDLVRKQRTVPFR